MQNTHPIILLCIATYIVIIVAAGIYLTQKRLKIQTTLQLQTGVCRRLF